MFSTAEPLASVPESLNAYFERSQELLQVMNGPISHVLRERRTSRRFASRDGMAMTRSVHDNTLEAVARVTKRCSTVITGLLVSETQADR